MTGYFGYIREGSWRLVIDALEWVGLSRGGCSF